MVLVQNTWWAQKFRLGSHQTTYSMAHSISEGEKEDKAEEEYESSNNDSDLVLVQLVVEKRVVRWDDYEVPTLPGHALRISWAE